jgi:hypothetical protein
MCGLVSTELMFITLQQLDETPELGIYVLRYAMHMTLGDNATAWACRNSVWTQVGGQYDAHWEHCYGKLKEWIESRPPLTIKAAKKLLEEEEADDIEVQLMMERAGKPGPPVILRHATIMALMRRHYLHKSWEEVTKRVCPCAQPHTIGRVRAQCQPRLEAEARILKRLIRGCKITLPPTPTVFPYVRYLVDLPES